MKRKSTSLTPYLFIAPHLVFFVVFLVFPTLLGIYISFFDWDFLTQPKFVGFANYAKLFTSTSIDSKNFVLGMRNTFTFVVITVPINVAFALLIATLINQMKRSRAFLRVSFFIPVVLSVTCVCTTWLFFADKQTGVINRYLRLFFGVEDVPWLTVQPYTWMILILTTIWWVSGRNIIYYLAGLGDVSPHLYEAASLDGANGIQKFFHITIPGIMRTLLFVVVMETISQFNIFGQPFMMTEGGPVKTTKVVLMFIRETAFKSFRMGMASAMSILLGLVIIIFTSVQFRLFMNPSDKEER